MKKIITAAAIVLALSACEPVEAPHVTGASSPPTKKVDPNRFGSGTYQVPQELKPGTYKTKGPDVDDISGMCYWARLSSFEGDFGDIITNGNTEGPATITVKKSDKGLELSGSCVWRKTK